MRDGRQRRLDSGRAILNDAGARRPEHSLWPHVPILARVVWADTGLEEWIETTAMGWTGDLVYVDMRRTDYGVNACWLHADDVRRRQAS
jgi:hypothetical protein